MPQLLLPRRVGCCPCRNRVNRYVPLALTLLGPIIVNILLIHLLMLPSGLPLAIIVTVLWIVVFLSVRFAFVGLFQQRVPVQGLG